MPSPRADTAPPAPQPVSRQVLADRYAGPGEHNASQIYRRVALALAQAERPERREAVARAFLRNMEQGAIGAGRIMANAGARRTGTMVNCFVHPVGAGRGAASFEAGLADACKTLSMGGGVGYDFSVLPPADAQDRAGLPSACEAIGRYDAASAALAFEGARRGAQMAVLSCTHPDLLAFARAKAGRKRWRGFNLSVAVSDAFLQAVVDDAPWTLCHRAAPGPAARARGAFRMPDGLWQYRRESARALWRAITEQALESAEPGLLYLDTINRANNLRALETLSAANPCGEQPLPPYGSCVLGPINLSRLVSHPFGVGGPATLERGRLARMTRIQVRLLDNVLALTRWPLPAHAAEARAKRRIGVGITGLADMLAMLGLRYDEEAGRAAARDAVRIIRDHAYAASAALAAERGPFPLYRPQDYLGADRVGAELPAAVRRAIGRHGLRNSHLLSFAPTGSVSLAFGDNCSNGIEPAFDWVYTRMVRLGREAPVQTRAENHAWRRWRHLMGEDAPLPPCFLSAASIAPEDHVAMLAALQPLVDAAISKSVPVPADCPLERAQALFLQAWRAGLKGLTLFRPAAGMDAVMYARDAPQRPCSPPGDCASCE